MKKAAPIKDLPLSDVDARKIVEAVERLAKKLRDPSAHLACAWSAARDAMLNYLTDRGYEVTLSADGERGTWSRVFSADG